MTELKPFEKNKAKKQSKGLGNEGVSGLGTFCVGNWGLHCIIESKTTCLFVLTANYSGLGTSVWETTKTQLGQVMYTDQGWNILTVYFFI